MARCSVWYTFGRLHCETLKRRKPVADCEVLNTLPSANTTLSANACRAISAASSASGRRAHTNMPARGRVVRDGNLITAGGVTAGIDFGLAVVAELVGRDEAEAIATLTSARSIQMPLTALLALSRELHLSPVLGPTSGIEALRLVTP